MQVNSYLSFNGQCEAAFKFYEQCLSGKVEMMIPYEGTPVADHMPADWRKRIIHARLKIGEGTLLGGDAPPERYQQPKGFSVSIQVKDVNEAERVFHALAENGQIQMPMQQTFFAARFGMLVDRFGIPWMVVCEQAARN